MTVHIVGGGLAGLAAAVACASAGHTVALYEASPHLGGRCRSYHHDAFGCEVDNGAHAVLSNNASTARYLRLIGAQERLQNFMPHFVDLRTRDSWQLKLPDALWDATCRPPGVTAVDLLVGVRLMMGQDFQPSPRALDTLWEPLCTSGLNTPFGDADVQLLAPVLRAMIGWGGLRRGLLLPDRSLSRTYITPAVEWLTSRGAVIRTTSPLRDVSVTHARAARLIFDQAAIDLGPHDRIILALPWWSPVLARFGIASADLPASPILNVHFQAGAIPPRFIGFCGGLAQWVWTRGELASVTISAADDAMNLDADVLAVRIWAEIAPVLNRPVQPVPPVHIVKERRATLRHAKGLNAIRTSARTTLSNVFVAGDWTATGLPCTLESAIKSGFLAADLLARP